MHILMIGGSGRTGKLTIEECLKRGHTVTALVRSSASLVARRGLTLIEGTPLEILHVEKAMKAGNTRPEVVIVTLASLRATDSPFAAPISPPRLMADSTANVVSVVQRSNSPNTKIVVCSAAGVGDSWSQLPLVVRLILGHSNVKYGYDDHNLLEKEIKKSGIIYVLAKPMRLADAGAAPLKFYDRGKCIGVAASTSRESVAVFLVDAAEKSDWDRKTPVFSN